MELCDAQFSTAVRLSPEVKEKQSPSELHRQQNKGFVNTFKGGVLLHKIKVKIASSGVTCKVLNGKITSLKLLVL